MQSFTLYRIHTAPAPNDPLAWRVWFEAMRSIVAADAAHALVIGRLLFPLARRADLAVAPEHTTTH